MAPLTEQKIILVVRDTRLDELVSRYNTVAQARFYIEHLGADFSDYQREDQVYKAAVKDAEQVLRRIGRVQTLQRAFLPNFIFGARDVVVVLGQDGLVANTLKYLHAQPVIGVNPDPERWDGLLLPFAVRDLAAVVPEVIAGGRDLRPITMARANLSDGQHLLAVNDLFIGAHSHVSARYRLRCGRREEDQSSSGVIVSTGLGSTGWFKSIVTGALGVAGNFIDAPSPADVKSSFAWDADYLYFSVREPFPSRATSASLVFGRVDAASPLVIESHMADNGVIFSDGMPGDCLAFNAGVKATIAVAAHSGHLVV